MKFFLLATMFLASCAAPRGSTILPERQTEGVWHVIGESGEGRPIRARTAGTGPRRIYLIAGIHGDERPAVKNAERLNILLDTSLPEGTVVRLVEDMNPDGTERSSRGNGRGVDLNRNWPASNFKPHRTRGDQPLSESETAAVHGDLLRFDPTVVIVLHAARGGPFVNFDGPAREEAQLFADAAAVQDGRWHLVADMGYPTPGSLGSWMGGDRKTPILTIELPRGESARETWGALRAGLLAAFAGQPSVAGE